MPRIGHSRSLPYPAREVARVLSVDGALGLKGEGCQENTSSRRVSWYRALVLPFAHCTLHIKNYIIRDRCNVFLIMACFICNVSALLSALSDLLRDLHWSAGHAVLVLVLVPSSGDDLLEGKLQRHQRRSTLSRLLVGRASPVWPSLVMAH